MSYEPLLRRTTELALSYLEELPQRRVGAVVDASGLLPRLGGPLPEEGEDPLAVVERLAADV